MAQGDPRKWHMPGWRIEQKYAQGVLIGNWDEDRYGVSQNGEINNISALFSTVGVRK